MKTVQNYLRTADREQLLDSIVYDMFCDTELLLEYKDRTISEIEKACRMHMDAFIDHLLSLKAVPSDCMVLYMAGTSSFSEKLHLINLHEIRKDIHASDYAFEITAWEEALGYLIADNPLTRDNIIDLLTEFLSEISFFGTEPEVHEKNLEEIHEDLHQAVKEIEEGKIVTASEGFEQFSKKHGFSVDKKDDKQECLYAEIVKAEKKYEKYSNWQERRLLLQSLGETAPSYEEDVECSI